MGLAQSNHGKGDEEDEGEGSSGLRPRLAAPSRSRLWRPFRTGSNSTMRQSIKEEQFSGMVRIILVSAEMQFKDKWFACVSLGRQTFRTATSIQTDKPEWRSRKTIVLEANGPRIVYISVFETNTLKKNNLVGYREVDLSDIFTTDVDHNQEVLDLYNPNSKTQVVGQITISYSAEGREETEKGFALRLLSIVDYDESGELSLTEFKDLIRAFGNRVSDKELESIFEKFDLNKDGRVSAEELADLVAMDEDRSMLLKRCPVCGESLGNVDELNDIIHMSLCFDEGTGSQIMTGGFLTEKQASKGWMFKLSEWASFSASYDAGGLKSGAAAAHILLFDRRTKRLVEELIDRKIVLSLRAVYQSKMTIGLLDMRTRSLLLNMSKKQGERMSSTQSAADIPRFIEFFQDRINVDEFKYPVDHYKTFNDFFVRELKPGCRPIAYEDNDSVAICGADCRLMAFPTSEDATRFWIKGRKFSINGLIGIDEIAKDFVNGIIVIFRLAPQDYHRFHVPVSGVVGPINNIPGHLYTVNPIAVNSKYCNVFTENKRAVTVLTTKEFGKVAFIAIGATMVGSITFTRQEGDVLKKGDEFGYFSFGGSTCICVFQEGKVHLLKVQQKANPKYLGTSMEELLTLQNSIELDEDLVANSGKSLETLVSVGDSLGVAKKYIDEDHESLDRPSVQDSVVGLDNEVGKTGVQISRTVHFRDGHIGLEEDSRFPDISSLDVHEKEMGAPSS